MHKRIVGAIMGVVKRYGEMRGGALRCYVMSQATGGFWQLCVVVDEDDVQMRDHILDGLGTVGKAIGFFFGEGLVVDSKGDRIIFS